jgi:hypothetical protein
MPAALDPQNRLLAQFGLRAIQNRGPLGEAIEHVDLAIAAAADCSAGSREVR